MKVIRDKAVNTEEPWKYEEIEVIEFVYKGVIFHFKDGTVRKFQER